MKWYLLKNKQPVLREGNGWFEQTRDCLVTTEEGNVTIAFWCNNTFNYHSTANPIKVKAWAYLPEPYGYQGWEDKHCGDCEYAERHEREMFVKCAKGHGLVGDDGKTYDCRRKITHACGEWKPRGK